LKGQRGAFDHELLEEIRAKNDIVEVISEYVALKQAGRTYKALCPFHTERTPSFSVSPDKQLFYCFGCGTGGDVFIFIERIENVSFPEAVRLLAERAGLSLSYEETVAERKAREEKELLYRVNEAAMDYFKWALINTREGSLAREYLKQRGIDEATIGKFGIGYALPAWDGLLRSLTAKGFSAEVVVKAGLAVKGERGEATRPYDRFRDRLMFPIWDFNGKVVGFGGRVLGDSTPKYLNSSETPIFSKGRTLYGLHLAKEAIRSRGRAIIVEGYMDAIAAHQHGIGEAVASLGTSLTREQAGLIARYAEEVVIAYDADEAGRAATLRGLEILSGQAGLRVRVVGLPKGEDPDSFIRRRGPQAFIGLVNGALPLTDYRLELLFERNDPSSVEGRVRIVKEAVPVIASLANAVERVEYCKKLSFRLGVDIEPIELELKKYMERLRRKSKDRFGENRNTINVKRGSAKSGYLGQKGANLADGEDAAELKARLSGPERVYMSSAYRSAERHLVQLMMEDGAIFQRVTDELGLESFFYPEHRAIASAIGAEIEERGSVRVDRVLARLESEDLIRAATEIFMEDSGELYSERDKVVSDCIRLMKRYRIQEEIKRLEDELKTSEAKGEVSRSREILSQLQGLMARLSREFASFYGPGL